MVESAIRNIIYSGCMLTHTYINYTKLYLIISNIYNTLSIISTFSLSATPIDLASFSILDRGSEPGLRMKMRGLAREESP